MLCPVCRQRKARRSCPALGETICSVCCATKRLIEINCPSTCGYLVAGREHPAAVVRRQQEQDVAALMPSIRSLSERQYQLFFLFQTVIAGQPQSGLARLVDEDVAEAAAAAAATIETEARGVLYEHSPKSLPAQKLSTEFRTLVAQIREQGATVYDHELATVLRAVERGARETRAGTAAGTGEDSAYLALMARLLQVNKAAAQERRARQGQGNAENDDPAASLILP